MAPRDVWCLIATEDEEWAARLDSALVASECKGVRVASVDDGIGFLSVTEFDVLIVSMGTDAAHELVSGARAMGRSRTSRMVIIGLAPDAEQRPPAAWVARGYDELIPADAGAEAILTALARPAADFDPSRALRHANGDRSHFRELLTHFADTAETRLAELRGAVGDEDAARVDASAHALEALAHRLAMPRLRDVSHRIAAHGRRGEVRSAASLFDELELRVSVARREARDEIDAA